jgi:hypothetical protein
VIQVGVQADQKAHRAKFARRNFFQPDGIAVRVKVQPGDGIGKFQPGAVVALQRKIADEIADARDGKFLARRSLVAERRRLEIFAGDFRRDFNLQRRGKYLRGERKDKCRCKNFFHAQPVTA